MNKAITKIIPKPYRHTVRMILYIKSVEKTPYVCTSISTCQNNERIPSLSSLFSYVSETNAKYLVCELSSKKKLRYIVRQTNDYKTVRNIKYCRISFFNEDGAGFISNFHFNCICPSFTFATWRRFPGHSEGIPRVLK